MSRWTLGAMWLVAMVFPAGAVDLHTLPRSSLGIVEAPADASEVAFAKLVGQRLHRYSVRTGLEGCADLCKLPNGGWVAEAISIGSHTSCSTLRQCPTGGRPVGRTVHSHPIELRFEPNAVDFALRDEPYQPGVVWVADDPRLFSDADYREPGYLAVFGQLYFQHGQGTEQRLGALSAP